MILSGILIISWLILMEGLLSLDNALVLATLVSTSGLDSKKQKQVLLYGLLGAYFFRILAVLGAVFLLQIWWLKVLGGAYLIFAGTMGLWRGEKYSGTVERIIDIFMPAKAGKFLSVLLQVEFTDAAFSIDSILAAVAVTDNIWLIIAGGILGILAIRFVAGIFIYFLEKHPILKKTAYLLVFIIGAKLAVSPWLQVQDIIFFGVLGCVFAGSVLFEILFLKKA